MKLNPFSKLALRAIPGAFVLNSGFGKLEMDDQTIAYLRDEAAKGMPMFADMEPALFRRVLGYGEIAVGAAMLLPFVPSRLAGLALGVFSSGLLRIYFSDPAKTEEDGIRPSAEGISMAKDSWLAAIAIALILNK